MGKNAFTGLLSTKPISYLFDATLLYQSCLNKVWLHAICNTLQTPVTDCESQSAAYGIQMNLVLCANKYLKKKNFWE